MPEVLGPQTILSKALPTGVDGTRLAQWAFRSGRTYAQVVNDLALALGDFNAEMARNWSWLYYITEELALEYPDGGAVTPLQEITDTDDVDSVHGTTIGHMIDLIAYGGGIGGSKRWFRDAREAQFLSQLQTIIRRAKWRFEQQVLTRWLTNTENAVGTGYDVPFVRGTGGNVDFTPPAFGGEAFTSSHDHYLGFNSSTQGVGLDDLLNGLAETLQEHGHMPPYTAMVSRADVATYRALTDFVQLVDTRIQIVERGGATAGAQYFAQGGGMNEFGVFGGFQSDYGYVELRATGRIPTGYAGMTKSYGQNDARNGIAIRVHPDLGFGAYVVPETTDDRQYPIKKVNCEFEFGVSVGQDRTNGAAGYLVAGGSWANPTIS